MKQTNLYKVKSLATKVEDVDDASRTVKGYLSAFDKVDSDRDVILRGAFAQSIRLRGPKSDTNRKIAFLRMHNWERQIGRFTELEEDDYGLKFVAVMGRSEEGKNALLDYQDGIIREHSIGFRYLESGMSYDEEKDVFNISELVLYEGSAVTLGANEFTHVVEVAKGMSHDAINAEAIALTNRIETIANALKQGKGTDERLYNLEMQLRVLQAKTLSLFESLRPERVKPSIATEAEKANHLDFLRSIANI